jgi:hypothetical protein
MSKSKEPYHGLCSKVTLVTRITDDQDIGLADSLECEGGMCPGK